MRHRMVVALLALAAWFVSLYLLLYKLGVVGSVACGGSDGCERVSLSPWASILGIPVAAFGVAGYLALFVTALVGLGERWVDRPGPSRWLAAMSGAGVAFSAYLTWLEAFVIRDWCRWCVAQALIIVAVFALSLAGLRSYSRRSPSP